MSDQFTPEIPKGIGGQNPVEKLIEISAPNELFFRITGDRKVYDKDDPTVAENVQKTVEKAIADESYTDQDGASHELSWDKRTKFDLATANIKYTLELLKSE